MYAWLDVDSDGEMTPEIDAVDLDRDGWPDENEVLSLHETVLLDPEADVKDWNAFLKGNGVLDPRDDLLYVDQNLNNKRDHGEKKGFTDADSGFGEPMFVCDDVDGDGVLDPDEKLVRLGSNKVAKVWVGKVPYTRGKNLATLDPFVFKDEYGYADARHGTAVSGILVGGNPGLQRYVGMAPSADLYLYDRSAEAGPTTAGVTSLNRLAWARADQVDILLWEYSTWGMDAMDGTANLERAMDLAYEQDGMLQVAPAGNLSGAGKHMQTTAAVGATELVIGVPEKGVRGEDYKSRGVILTLYWKGKGKELSIQLTPPGGAPVELPAVTPDAGTSLVGDLVAHSSMAVSDAGMASQMIGVLHKADDGLLPTGKWQLTVTNKSSKPLFLHGFINEFAKGSGWSRTVVWETFESDASTLCSPSTANSAISVAAYGGRFGEADELGKLRGYSGRGPRVDGAVGMDIGAPDDPFAPLSAEYVGWGALLEGAYSAFGGTSGAGPHVAGSLALLMQAMPELDPAGWQGALLSGTEVEPHMGQLPNGEWGFGKVNAYKAVHGVPAPPPNKLPVAIPRVTAVHGLEATLWAGESEDPDGDLLEYRWDFGYDGSWDVAWTNNAVTVFTAPVPGTVQVKLAVRDGAGAVGEGLLTFDPAYPPIAETDALSGDGIGADVADGLAADAADGGSAVAQAAQDSDGGGCTASRRVTGSGAWVVWLATLLVALAVRRRYSPI